MSSPVHYFKAISDFKLQLQSGNAHSLQNWQIFVRMTLKLDHDAWPWQTIGHLFYDFSSFVHHLIAIGEFKLELQYGNCGSKLDIFARCDLEICEWPWITIEHFYYDTSSSVHHFITIGELKPELQTRNAQFGSKSDIFSCDQAALQMVFSVCPSVCLSVCLSVCHTFLTMFQSSYHQIFRSYY